MIRFALQVTLCWILGICSAYALDLPLTPYQDVFVNGQVLAKGNGPDCASRYEAIKKVLDLYNRPITILDIGAAEGYFSFRAAYDYDACCIMISDPSWNDNVLEKLCHANTELDKVVLLSKQITVDELTLLSECEHFDVVLALNVIHHFGDNWKRGYDAILNLGDNIIIETPPSTDLGACGRPVLGPINTCIDQEPYILLGRFLRHTDPNQIDRLVWIPRHKKTFTRKAYLFPAEESVHTIEIVSSYDAKSIKKFYNGQFVMETPWIPGINLISFKSLNGCYPTTATLLYALNEITSIPSTDWFPHNVILSGKHLHLIDTDDPQHEGTTTLCYTEKLHRFMIDIILATSQKEIIDRYRECYNSFNP